MDTFKARIVFIFLTVLLPAGLVYGQAYKTEDAAVIFANLRVNPYNKIILTSLAKAQKASLDKSDRIHYLEVCYLGFLSLGDIKMAKGAKRALLAVAPANSYCNEYPLESIFVDCSDCGGTGKSETECPQCNGSGKCSKCKGSGQLSGVGERKFNCFCHTTGKPGKCHKCSGVGKLVRVCNKCRAAGKVPDTNSIKKAYLDLLKHIDKAKNSLSF